MTDSYTPFPGNPGGGFPQAGGFPASGPFGSPAQRPAGAPLPQEAAPATRSSKKAKAPKDAKTPTKRAVSKQFVIAVVFALAAAGGVWYTTQSGGGEVYVVRAASDIAAGTQLGGDLLEAALLPADAVEPNTFTGQTGEEAIADALEDLEGVVTQYPLGAKSQIRSDQFGIQATLGADLAPTERLVSIQANVGQAVAGGLRVGDRVDIVGATDQWTSVVAYDVPIVAITVSEDRYNSVADQQSADKDVSPGEVLPGDPVPGIYVVKVPAELVPLLLNWNESATLHLAYRGTDAQNVVVPDNHLGEQVQAPVGPAATEQESADAHGEQTTQDAAGGDTAQD